MKLAFSNIAWDPCEDEQVAYLLKRYSVNAIDVAPGKYFPDPSTATDNDINSVKIWWAERGIEIVGMQALLFGTVGLNLFGTSDVQTGLLKHLHHICRIAAGLGARHLVFGSPKNRNRTGLSDEEAISIAVPFFRHLGDIAQIFNVSICLEPNPICYGANFMTNCNETADIVEQVAHPSIKMQLDTGALNINNENIADIIHRHSHLIGHIHASEPDLLPLGDGTTDHNSIYNAVVKKLPEHVVSIEMLATKAESHISSIERALNTAIYYYRKNSKE